MDNIDLSYKKLKPTGVLAQFVDSFIYIENSTENNQQFVLFPDGRIDLIFSHKKNNPLKKELFKLDKAAKSFVFERHTAYFIICFTPLGAEYLLGYNNQLFTNDKINLVDNFSNITEKDFENFSSCSEKILQYLISLIPNKIEERKLALFNLIYSHQGEMLVHEIEQKIGWSSRQINRYFNKQFGLSLKTYSTIIRFRASFNQIREGKLYPLQNFTDQAHFIKEIKKFSNFIPKDLAKNENDRFIQFSILPDE